MGNFNKKQLISAGVIIFLLISIPLVIILVRQRQIFKPKAAQPTSGSRINVSDTSNNELQGEPNPVSNSDRVNLKIFYDPTTSNVTPTQTPQCVVDSDCHTGINPVCSRGLCLHGDPLPPTITAGHPTPTTPPSSSTGSISFWKMNESSGTTVADSVGTNTGNATGTSVTTGKVGNARSFNGSSDYIRIANTPTLAVSQFTLAAWVKPNDPNDADGFGDTIISKEGVCKGYQLLWDGGNSRFGLMTDCVTTVGTSGKVNNGTTWYFVVATYDGSLAKLYVNGIEEASRNLSYTPNTGDAFQIGSYFNSRYFKGVIDEVGVWNRALTPSEVTALSK